MRMIPYGTNLFHLQVGLASGLALNQLASHDQAVYTFTFILLSVAPLSYQQQCKDPPQVANAEYTRSEIYPLRTELEYRCANSYVNKGTSNTRLVCSALENGNTLWTGDHIDCQLSSEISKW